MSNQCVNPPSGPGVWIAYPTLLGGYANAAERIRDLGFKVVYPRAGDGRYKDQNWTKQACESLLNAGLEVYPWRYSRAGTLNWQGELDGYKQDLEWGVHGVVVDAEIHWQAQHNDEAHLFVDKLLDLECFVADAPWPYIGYHSYPDAFGRLHARMPQLYWTEINPKGAKHNFDASEKQWTQWESKKREEGREYLIKPRWPIGVTYGNKELKKLGAGQCPGEFLLDDLMTFIDLNTSQPSTASLEASVPPRLWSLYSLEAASPLALEFLKERQKKSKETVLCESRRVQ